jgi:Xaa-Pro aminopeptidase
MHFFGPLVGYSTEAPKALDIYSKTAARVPGSQLKDSMAMLAKMRLIKEPREIEKIAKATEISVAGHLEAMRRVRPEMREWDLKQILEDAFRKGGARNLAYGSIVGAGPDGCVLHYPRDDRTIQDGELVLIDAGAEFDHYASDVTRTFPANGKFTPEQRKIYEVVLRAQQAAIDRIRPGATWDELQDIASKVIADAGYYDYYIHSLGHPVGLAVHDVNLPELPFVEGMVLTIEPGIYMPGNKIGIRIEDMLVVTKTGSRNLSEKLPRDPDAIEKLMAAAR